MKQIQKIFTLQTLLIVVILLLPAIVHAQPDNTPGDPDAPIDGGLSLLIAGGVGYGVKKIKEKRKENKLS